VTDIVTSRFQLAFLVAILFQGLQSVAIPTTASAADQEVRPRHSLIHRPPEESLALPATTQGTILQPPNAQLARITSPIGPPKTSVSPTTVPLTHHRSLTKRPAMASTTAPATSSQTLRAALTSGIAAGQVMQTTADTTKGATPAATAPVTKSTAAALPGATSTGSAVVAPTSPSPFAGAAGVRSAASAGSRSAPSSSGSRSALNLLQNPAIAALLQPPAPIVTNPPAQPPPPTPPPSTPPPSTPPPSTPPPPPPSPTTGSATLTWSSNGSPNLAGYKVYVGTQSGLYTFPGSPFTIGRVTSYTITNLPSGQTYFFALSAYDNAGNESPLSNEVSKSIY
jgi:hypothetical protein